MDVVDAHLGLVVARRRFGARGGLALSLPDVEEGQDARRDQNQCAKRGPDGYRDVPSVVLGVWIGRGRGICGSSEWGRRW